jgi:hypothetical protein
VCKPSHDRRPLCPAGIMRGSPRNRWYDFVVALIARQHGKSATQNAWLTFVSFQLIRHGFGRNFLLLE